jgi:hypothetical protein
MKKFVFSLILFASFGFPSLFAAANHFILAGATGTGSGSDWTNAYTAIPATLVRGDTYYIGGGSYGSHDFKSLSGTTYVYLVKATGSAHGTDTGWQSAYGTNQAVFSSSSAVWTVEQTYLSINGMTGSGASGYGIKLVTTSTTEGNSPITLWSGNGSGFTCKYCELACPDPTGNMANRCFDERTNIYANVISTGILIQYCYLHGGLVGVTFSGNGSTNQGDIVEHCYLRSFAKQQHSEVFQLANTNNITIRYNVVEDLLDPSTTYIEPQQNGGPEPVGIYVYGNVFHGISSGEGSENPSILSLTSGEVADTVYIYNNTFYGLHACSPSEGMADSGIGCSSGGKNCTNTIVRNNIWQSCVYGPGLAGVTTQDHNLLNTGGANFVNAAAGDFHLAASTTGGVALGSPYNIDADGNTRGADGVWDLGAYEYVSGGAAPSAPVVTSALTATASAGTAFSYTITGSNSPTSYSASPLAVGLSVNTSTGVISGTPTAVGTTNVVIGATNTGGTGTATLVITVNAVPPSDATTAITAH